MGNGRTQAEPTDHPAEAAPSDDSFWVVLRATGVESWVTSLRQEGNVLLPDQTRSLNGGAQTKKGDQLVALRSFILMVSRAGLEPATHWLKASCSTD
jgi:hypothetical protein